MAVSCIGTRKAKMVGNLPVHRARSARAKFIFDELEDLFLFFCQFGHYCTVVQYSEILSTWPCSLFTRRMLRASHQSSVTRSPQADYSRKSVFCAWPSFFRP